MHVKNGSHINEIPIHIHEYKSFAKRLKGLMFRLKPIVNEGILLHPCNSIHMFFMFFSIDAVFIDKNGIIVALRENVKPWTVVLPVKDAVSTLELPAGAIAKYSIKEGQEIDI
jgi:uncharacterized protein